MTPAPSAPGADNYSLRADLQAAEASRPGWHVWVDDVGRIHGTHCYTRGEMKAIEAALTASELASGCHAASGISLEAWTGDGIKQAIDEHQHAWKVALQNAGIAA